MPDINIPSHLRDRLHTLAGATGIKFETLAEVYRLGFAAKLGATGTFPSGQPLYPEDRGELTTVVYADRQQAVVRLEFGISLSWVAMAPADARALGALLVEMAAQVDGAPR